MEQAVLEFEVKAPSINSLNAMVLGILSNEVWWMPWEICAAILRDKKMRISDSSCTARLRDLRKKQFGSHTIEKRIREGSRAYEYRLVK